MRTPNRAMRAGRIIRQAAACDAAMERRFGALLPRYRRARGLLVVRLASLHVSNPDDVRRIADMRGRCESVLDRVYAALARRLLTEGSAI